VEINNPTGLILYYLSDNGIFSRINSEKDLKKGSIGNYVPSTKKIYGKRVSILGKIQYFKIVALDD